MLYSDDFVREILELYVAGVDIVSIANYMGTSDIHLINEIIDSYSPHN